MAADIRSRRLTRSPRRMLHSLSAVCIRAHNDSENAPIVAINRKLGYQPQPGLYQYVHEMRAAEDKTEG